MTAEQLADLAHKLAELRDSQPARRFLTASTSLPSPTQSAIPRCSPNNSMLSSPSMAPGFIEIIVWLFATFRRTPVSTPSLHNRILRRQ